MLCESTDGRACNAQLEPCMGNSRAQRAEKMHRLTLEASNNGGEAKVWQRVHVHQAYQSKRTSKPI